MRNSLLQHLHFTRLERKGMFCLSLISCIGLVLPSFYGFIPADTPTDLTKDKMEITLFQEEIEKLNQIKRVEEKKKITYKKSKNKYSSNHQIKTQKRVAYFSFNPNTISQDSLLLLGISKRVAGTWAKFRKNGGTFYTPEDVQKIYGLDSVLYQKLAAYIDMPTKKQTAKKPTFKKKTSRPIEINTATPEDWQSLRGIGPYFANKICNFRNKLGGFSHIEQVAETYHFPDSVFQQIKPYLQLNFPVHQIKLNDATLDQLKAHPYLKYRDARTIIHYREQHGPFQQVEDIRHIHSLSPELVDKLIPYFTIDK